MLRELMKEDEGHYHLAQERPLMSQLLMRASYCLNSQVKVNTQLLL